MSNYWTPERIKVLRVMAEHGLTAKEIGGAFGVTRNAILGLCHRQGIRLVMTPEKQKAAADRLRAWHGDNPVASRAASAKGGFANAASQGGAQRKARSIIGDREALAKKLTEMREAGVTWGNISKHFGVSKQTPLHWAKELGVFKRKNNPPINAEEIAYLVKSWIEYRSVEEIANTLGRTFDVTRQIILRLQRQGVIKNRDPFRSIAVQRYGMDWQDPRTGREMLDEALDKKGRLTLSEKHEKRQAHEDAVFAALEQMGKDIEGGMSREAAIFRAREVCTLEEIAACFGVTRERIRQICKKYGERHGRSSNDGINPAEGGAGT